MNHLVRLFIHWFKIEFTYSVRHLKLHNHTAGLDVKNRPTLLSLLHSLHVARSPRIILALRPQDPIPDWITHLALVHQGTVTTGKKEDVLASDAVRRAIREETADIGTTSARRNEGKVLVDMNNVKVSYGERKVRIPALTK
jgi:hypothetical protein